MLRAQLRRLVGSIALIIVPVTFSACQSQQLRNAWNARKAEILIRQARESYYKSDFRKNADLLKQASETDPTNALVWGRLCEAYQATEELDLALKACEQDVKLNATGTSFNSLGWLYEARGDYKNAAAAYEKAASKLEVSPVYGNLVRALLGTKQFDKAVPAAQRLIELSREDPPETKSVERAYQLLGVAYLGVGEKDKANAAFGNARGNPVHSNLARTSCSP